MICCYGFSCTHKRTPVLGRLERHFCEIILYYTVGTYPVCRQSRWNSQCWYIYTYKLLYARKLGDSRRIDFSIIIYVHANKQLVEFTIIYTKKVKKVFIEQQRQRLKAKKKKKNVNKRLRNPRYDFSSVSRSDRLQNKCLLSRYYKKKYRFTFIKSLYKHLVVGRYHNDAPIQCRGVLCKPPCILYNIVY